MGKSESDGVAEVKPLTRYDHECVWQRTGEEAYASRMFEDAYGMYYLADEADARIAELEAERDAAGADAERYRWLRSAEVGPSSIWELLSDDCHPPIMTLKCGAELDAAIDAARGAE